MKANLKVKGMHCKSCVSIIKMALEENDVKADVTIGNVKVDFDEKKISIEKIKELIKKEGYEVW